MNLKTNFSELVSALFNYINPVHRVLGIAASAATVRHLIRNLPEVIYLIRQEYRHFSDAETLKKRRNSSALGSADELQALLPGVHQGSKHVHYSDAMDGTRSSTSPFFSRFNAGLFPNDPFF